MVKKMLFAALAAGLVSATTLSLQTAPVQAESMRGMTCKDAAEMKYPDDRKMRHSWKKMCKDNWKMHEDM